MLLNRFDEAAAEYEQVIAARDKQRKRDNPATLNLRRKLAEVLIAQDKLDRAETILEECAEMYRQSGLDGMAAKLNLAEVLRTLAECRIRQQRFADAEALARESIELRKVQTTPHWSLYASQLALGQSLTGQQKFDEAETILLAADTGLDEKRGAMKYPDRTRQFKLLHERLVQLYEAWGKPDEADKWRAAGNE